MYICRMHRTDGFVRVSATAVALTANVAALDVVSPRRRLLEFMPRIALSLEFPKRASRTGGGA